MKNPELPDNFAWASLQKLDNGLMVEIWLEDGSFQGLKGGVGIAGTWDRAFEIAIGKTQKTLDESK